MRMSAGVLLFAVVSAHSAFAVDVPMDPALALDALDSKTCYGVVQTDNRLLGYELNELLVSNGGKLVRLTPQGAFVIGDRRPRRYVSRGIEVVIAPFSIIRLDNGADDTSEIREEALATVSEGGRRRRYRVNVTETCSP